MTLAQNLVRECIAWRAAQDLRDGDYVNLGVGIPSEVARFVPSDVEVILHSENGILGAGPRAEAGSINKNLVNASQQFITVKQGASFFDCCESFAMLRGGHIDIALLGAYQVGENGDLANWDRGNPGIPPAVGGAMDIAAGARTIWVLMELLDSKGKPRLLRRVTLPVTGISVVKRVYTELAIIDLTPDGAIVREIDPAISFPALQALTEWRLTLSENCKPLRLPDFYRETEVQ